MTRRSRSSGPTALAALTASLALVLSGTAAAAAPAAAAEKPQPLTLNGYRSVGYFQAGSPKERDFQVADLDSSGAIDNLTHLNYAFDNISHDDLTCFIADKPSGPPPDGSDGAGDAQNDFLRTVSATDSVDGVGDTAGQRLAGNFNQLRKLKKKYPSKKILISLGGWTWSKNFSLAAATPASRERLVASCIDLYLRGNLPSIDGRGGKGAAAGVFDGVDVDWEWPGAPDWAQEVGNHVDPDHDKANFIALMAEFRRQLDAYGQETGRRYLLTAFAPASPGTAAAGGWNTPELFDSLDFANVQGYDLHGGWVPNQTGHQGNLFPTEHNWGLSVSTTLAMYADAGIDKAKLNMGLAAYGRGWQGVTDGEQAWTTATGVAPGPKEAGTDWYANLRDVGEAYFDPVAGASWRWDGDQWWSLDDPTSVAFKADWLAEQGYGGAMWWDVTGDYDNELTGALGTTLRAAERGPIVEPQHATPWYASAVYTGGEVVAYGSSEYRARWWTRNQRPGTSQAWVRVGPLGTFPAEPGVAGAAWSASTTYTGGELVSYRGVNYRALWWTRGERPGSTPYGAWSAVGPYDD